MYLLFKDNRPLATGTLKQMQSALEAYRTLWTKVAFVIYVADNYGGFVVWTRSFTARGKREVLCLS